MAKQKRGRLLEPDEYRTKWAAASFSDRRRITRVVARGVEADDVADALLAVPTARRQRAFWRWAWVFGLVPALTVLGEGPQVFVANAVFGMLLMGGLSFWKHSRAVRAEQANLALLGVAAVAERAPRGSGQDPPRRGPVERLRGLRRGPQIEPSGRSEAELLGLEPERPVKRPRGPAQQPDLGKPRTGTPSPATSAKKRKRRKKR